MNASGAEPDVSGETANADEMSLGRLVRRLAVGLIGLLCVVGALSYWFKDPLTDGSRVFVEQFGLAGVFGGVLFTDTFLLTHEPVLFAAHAGGLGFWPIFLTASAASICAGGLGWMLGSLFGRAAPIQHLFKRYRITEFLSRYGVWAIAVAALTPFPFSAATWASGAASVSFKTVMLGSLFRIPKVLFYFGLIILGWGVS